MCNCQNTSAAHKFRFHQLLLAYEHSFAIFKAHVDIGTPFATGSCGSRDATNLLKRKRPGKHASYPDRKSLLKKMTRLPYMRIERSSKPTAGEAVTVMAARNGGQRGCRRRNRGRIDAGSWGSQRSKSLHNSHRPARICRNACNVDLVLALLNGRPSARPPLRARLCQIPLKRRVSSRQLPPYCACPRTASLPLVREQTGYPRSLPHPAFRRSSAWELAQHGELRG